MATPTDYDQTTTDSPIARDTFARSVSIAVGADFDDVVARYPQHRAAALGLDRVTGSPVNSLSCDGQETTRAVDAVRDVHGDSWFRHFGRFYADDFEALAVEMEAGGFDDAREILTVWAATFVWPFTAEDAWINHTGAARSDAETDVKQGVDAIHGDDVTADVKPYTDKKRAYKNGYIKADYLVCYAETGDGKFAFGVESRDKNDGDDAAYIKARDTAGR